MQVVPQLNFHHNFSEPLRLANTNLFYDPVRVDRQLTKLLLEGDDQYETSRKAPATRR